MSIWLGTGSPEATDIAVKCRLYVPWEEDTHAGYVPTYLGTYHSRTIAPTHDGPSAGISRVRGGVWVKMKHISLKKRSETKHIE